jgi:hypothetical protein
MELEWYDMMLQDLQAQANVDVLIAEIEACIEKED